MKKVTTSSKGIKMEFTGVSRQTKGGGKIPKDPDVPPKTKDAEIKKK